MPEYYFAPHVLRGLRAGAHGHLLDALARELRGGDCTRERAQRVLRGAAHLLEWSSSRGIPAEALDDHALGPF